MKTAETKQYVVHISFRTILNSIFLAINFLTTLGLNLKFEHYCIFHDKKGKNCHEKNPKDCGTFNRLNLGEVGSDIQEKNLD